MYDAMQGIIVVLDGHEVVVLWPMVEGSEGEGALAMIAGSRPPCSSLRIAGRKCIHPQ